MNIFKILLLFALLQNVALFCSSQHKMSKAQVQQGTSDMILLAPSERIVEIQIRTKKFIDMLFGNETQCQSVMGSEQPLTMDTIIVCIYEQSKKGGRLYGFEYHELLDVVLQSKRIVDDDMCISV